MVEADEPRDGTVDDRGRPDRTTGRIGHDHEASLFVDMDGVLVHTDTTTEAVFTLVRDNPAAALLVPLWLLKGRAYLKRRIAERVDIDPARLPYNHRFVAYLKAERAAGRRLVLATAADAAYGERVAAHLGLFDAVIGSDGTVDLSGPRKLEAIRDLTGDGPFGYAGNHRQDLPILEHARTPIVVNPEPALRRIAATRLEHARTFDDGLQTRRDCIFALHPWRWLINGLVLLPVLLMTDVGGAWEWLHAAGAAIAFCLFASALYLFDDLLHLAKRRSLPRESHSPVVAGRVSADRIAPVVPALAVAGLVLAALVSVELVALFGLFAFVWALGTTTAPHAAVAAVLAAGLLSAIRVLAGGVAIAAVTPLWLIGVGFAVGAVVELGRPRRLGFI